MKKHRIIAVVAAVASSGFQAPATAQTFDWNVKAHRLMLAGALNNWADFCSGVFHFDRVPKKSNDALEPKINSHLLLSSTPMMEVERWGGWLPYMRTDSGVAKPAMDRAADALLAARADPSSMVAAEKLYTDTLRGHFQTVFGKCQEGAHEPFIAENFYSGDGDFDKVMEQVTIDFASSVQSLDEPEQRKVVTKKRR